MGLLAGRRTPGITAVIILVAFSVSVPGIGVSQFVWDLFLAAAAFEFVRQFVGWSHAGYISEHMPSGLRAMAIGMTIMFSGLAGTIFAWVVPTVWNLDASDFKSAGPFPTAVVLGLVGAVRLLLYGWKFSIWASANPNDQLTLDISCYSDEAMPIRPTLRLFSSKS